MIEGQLKKKRYCWAVLPSRHEIWCQIEKEWMKKYLCYKNEDPDTYRWCMAKYGRSQIICKNCLAASTSKVARESCIENNVKAFRLGTWSDASVLTVSATAALAFSSLF